MSLFKSYEQAKHRLRKLLSDFRLSLKAGILEFHAIYTVHRRSLPFLQHPVHATGTCLPAMLHLARASTLSPIAFPSAVASATAG